MGSVMHPLETAGSTWTELPPEACQPEIDIEETLDIAPFGPRDGSEIWMSYTKKRPQPLVLSVDTSLSMTGDKMALTAVSLAVVFLQFPDDPIGIVAFENEARVIKRPSERLGTLELIERFLDVPAQGYTHLEEGLTTTLALCSKSFKTGRSKPVPVILLTDGKYTAGRDPSYLAKRFKKLIVMKMGDERAGEELCHELASGGRGTMKLVAGYEELPLAMYGVVKSLLRAVCN